MSISKTELSKWLSNATITKEDSFTAVVGNPPYQLASEGANTASSAIYHNYMIAAQQSAQYVSMVYPSRWMLGGTGTGLEEFRITEGNSKHYTKFYDYNNGEMVFPNTSINGGVNYFLWDKNKTTGTIEYHYNSNNIIEKETLSDNDFVRDPVLYNILEKIHTNNSMENMILTRAYYGTEVSNIKNIQKLHKENAGTYCYSIVPGQGLQKIEIDYPNRKNRIIDKYRVGISKTASMLKRNTYPRADRIFIIEPHHIVSESFLNSVPFETEQEANNCLLYLKTDFANFLLGIVTPTHNTTSKNYRLIPMIDFSTGEIIDNPGVFLDFSDPESLDKQLYSIYNIIVDEQHTITKDLKKWRDKSSITADK